MNFMYYHSSLCESVATRTANINHDSGALRITRKNVCAASFQFHPKIKSIELNWRSADEGAKRFVYQSNQLSLNVTPWFTR